jgi:hypothetical protein
MEVGVKHPVSLAAFSVVVSRALASRRQVPAPADHPLARPGGPGSGFLGRPGRLRAWRPTGAAPCQAIPRPYDLALRSGPGRCCRRGFACYVWDPVTTAGAAGRGSGQAPAGFRGQGCWLASRPSARPARAGLPGRRRGREACPRPACASAWPGPGLFINPRLFPSTPRRRLPGGPVPAQLRVVRSCLRPQRGGRSQPPIGYEQQCISRLG